MSVPVLFFALLAGLGGWWLARQKLVARPWLEHGVLDGVPDFEASRDPAMRTALGFLLAVIGSLFALLAGAWFMRRELGDWQPLPLPGILWINTAALVLSSLALEWTQVAARRGNAGGVRLGLALAVVAALAFLGGQLAAWQELAAAGYYVAENPANSFFYMLTALHGLHILGGLAALGWTAARAWRGARVEEVRLGVELSATYWLFMLLVWMGLFALVAGWAGDFIEMCRQLLS